MKFIPSRRRKTRKLIAKIWICIAILLIAIASVFLFSEKVHKIGMVENIKNVLVGQVKIVQEKIQSNTSDLTNMDEMLLEDENEMQQLNDSSEKNIAAYSEDIVKKTDNVTKTAFSQYVPYTNAKNIVSNGMAENGSGTVVLTNENPTAVDVCYTVYWGATFEGYSDDFQMIAVEKNTNPNVATATAISTKSDGIPCIQVNFTSGTETGTTTIEIGYSVSNVKKNIEDINSDPAGGFAGYISYTVTNDVSKDTEEIKISPPTDKDIKEFYNDNNRAVIVRCIDNNSHSSYTSRIADNSYEIGEVEVYNGSNENLSTSEWPYMCKTYINQQYYLNLWHKNFQSSRGTHYLVDSTKEVIAPFYYFKGGYCTYAQTTLSQGWYCLAEDIPVYVDITQNVNNIKKSFILNYDANGGTNVPDSQSIVTTSNNHTFIVSGQKPQRENYDFEGWSNNPGENNTVNYNIGSPIALTLESPTKTIYAVWREKTYTVTYTDGVVGETVFADQGYEGFKAGETTPAFDCGTPTRDGYTFMGWSPAINPVVNADDADDSGNIIYTATWQKKYITGIEKKIIKNSNNIPSTININISEITFPNAEGKVVFPNDSSSITLLYTITVTGDSGVRYMVTDTGATYIGGDSMEGRIPESGSAIIYVTKTFTVNDISDQYSVTNTATVTPGKGNESSSSSSEITLVTEMVTLTYDANGGINAPSATTVENGTNVTIKSKGSMYKEGYIFLGWNINKNATVADWEPGDTMRLNENATLYAVWKEIEYTTPYTIEYYYDNILDYSKTERRTSEPTKDELKQKIELNVKENFSFEKAEGWKREYNIIKVYYKSENSVPVEPTDPETGKRLYTITIENDKSGHTYNSYQVFQGDYYEKEENGKKIPLLSNIEWGPELQKEAEEGKTHGDKIVEALKLQNEEIYKDCKTAADVAYALEGKENDGDIIREFTNVVGKYLLDNNITLTKGTKTLIEEKDINGNVNKSNYKIDKLEPGYYIVIDAETQEKDDSYSRYLIDVVQDVTMEPKSSIPTLNKIVKENKLKTKVEGTGTSEDNPVQYEEDDKYNTATYREKSETYNPEDYDIAFELSSNIPQTDGYSSYKFEIVDTLSKGFDFDEKSLVVIAKGDAEKGIPDKTINTYTVDKKVIDATNSTEVIIRFNDLVGQIADGTVKEGQDIVITYNARLNENCEVGNTPNINEAYLKYSNNPYDLEETTQTTTQTTYTYTIDLDISKIAEKAEEQELQYLGGAEFEIYDGPEYTNPILPIPNTNRKKIATITSSSEEVNKGHAIYSSLGAGTYYIKEVKAPDGYNKLKGEIEIEIMAIYDNGTVDWKIIDKTTDKLVKAEKAIKEISGETEGEIKTIPYIALEVQNTSGYQLPITGGTGTVIFTLTGLGIMALAVVCLKSNKKK